MTSNYCPCSLHNTNPSYMGVIHPLWCSHFCFKDTVWSYFLQQNCLYPATVSDQAKRLKTYIRTTYLTIHVPDVVVKSIQAFTCLQFLPSELTGCFNQVTVNIAKLNWRPRWNTIAPFLLEYFVRVSQTSTVTHSAVENFQLPVVTLLISFDSVFTYSISQFLAVKNGGRVGNM